MCESLNKLIGKQVKELVGPGWTIKRVGEYVELVEEVSISTSILTTKTASHVIKLQQQMDYTAGDPASEGSELLRIQR